MPLPRRVARLLVAAVLSVLLALGGAAAAYAGSSRVTTYGDQVAPTRIVTLGDSVTAGTNSDGDDFGQVLAADEAVSSGGAVVTNFGVPGATTTTLLIQLSLGEVASALADADLVVVTIGANNVSVDDAADPAPAAAQVRAETLDALDRITVLAPHARVVVTTYWNVAQDGAVAAACGDAYVVGSHVVTSAVNGALRDAARDGHAVLADLETAYAVSGRDVTELLAPDGDHPNAAGHRVIATAIELALADRSA